MEELRIAKKRNLRLKLKMSVKECLNILLEIVQTILILSN